jgi:hypothetical protein
MVVRELDIEIEKLKTSGSIEFNAKIYQDFNLYAKELGLNIAFSIFKDTEKAHTGISIANGKYQSVSTISIMLKNTQNLIDNNIKKSNWDSKYIHTQRLIDNWYSLLEKYKYPIKYKTIPMLILFYSLEDFVISRLVYLCKNEIKEWMKNEKIEPLPEYIYCSSSPSYNIIFKNENDFNLFNDKYAHKVSTKIHTILKSNDKYDYYNTNKLKINYLHTEMKDINLYGLSRED